MATKAGTARARYATESVSELSCDLLVIGGGVAGLSAARQAAEAGLDVLIADKGAPEPPAEHPRFELAATNLAQGGVAVVGLSDAPGGADGSDTAALHVADTLDAGAGLCVPAAVEQIVAEGASAVSWLISLGARFDSSFLADAADPSSSADSHPLAAYVRTREGGHSRRRIIHAGGDATGAEVQRALESSLVVAPAHAARPGAARTSEAGALSVRVLPGAQCQRVKVAGGQAVGAEFRTPSGVVAVAAPATLLATGGAGQLYAATTAPVGALGDGWALALAAGAQLADIEFTQFHPTVLFAPGARGRRPLISEAVRGEGAHLVDSRGRSVTAGVDPRGDLAPRDIVSRAIAVRLAELGEDHVFLDARHIADFHQRFPTVTAGCAQAGIDPQTDLIPVAPAAHYSCGGIVVDAHGRTSVPGLYAAGECSRTGLHGANRLASNSLLEGLVIGRAVGQDAVRLVSGGKNCAGVEAVPDNRANRANRANRENRDNTALRDNADTTDSTLPSRGCATQPLEHLAASELAALQLAMTQGAGVTRTARSLEQTHKDLTELPESSEKTVALAMVMAASARTETRGCHTRLDYPKPDAQQQHSLAVQQTAEGLQIFPREDHR